MATKHQLAAEPRQIIGRKVRQLRKSGKLPGNVFGKSVTSVNVQINSLDFAKLYQEVGESTLIYLDVAGEKEARPVLVREVTRHPLTGQLLHVDFNQVNLKEKVTAPVAIELVGEAPAETDKLGILVQQLDEVEVEALPTDMPEKLEISVASLVAVGDTILVKDIKVDAKISVKSDPEEIVAKIEELAKEEVVEAPPAEATPAAEGETPTETPSAPEATPATES